MAWKVDLCIASIVSFVKNYCSKSTFLFKISLCTYKPNNSSYVSITQNEGETKAIETKIEDQTLPAPINNPNEPNHVLRESSESKFEAAAKAEDQGQVVVADLAKKEEEDFNATYESSVGAINDEKVRVEYLERGVEVMEPAEGDNIVHIVGMFQFF